MKIYLSSIYKSKAYYLSAIIKSEDLKRYKIFFHFKDSYLKYKHVSCSCC